MTRPVPSALENDPGRSMPAVRPTNLDVADALERVSDLLDAQGANAWRVRAYRAAAQTARTWPRPLLEVYEEEGQRGLQGLPSIGRSIAAAVREILVTGRLALLDHLEGEVGPEGLFTTVPGIGEDLARRIHDALGIDSLEDLEMAAHDGRLADVRGFGPRRVHAVRDALATLLGQAGRRRALRIDARSLPAAAPSVTVLLDVDADYRQRAAAGRLRKIAPRRFNPKGEAWLPIFHTEGGGWSFTAMWSNTARAHALGTTNDWVVVFYEQDGREGQATVVTETRGPLEGRRVVRGRERECLRHYRLDKPA